jgi:2-keto-4-pentenoate hydratase/2-oxohepta-3-ene-1,7-dioic acid hydratase in catechol pathway
MKLLSYRADDHIGYAVVREEEGTAVPVDGDMRVRYETIRQVLAEGDLDELAAWAEKRDATLSLDDLNYQPPLWDAEKVICIGVNYPKRHPIEGDVPPPEHITVFNKFAGSVVGHGKPLVQPPPPMSETMDYEGELVLVIGRGGRFIPKDQAFEHIAGYTIMNDGSVREWQKHSLAAGKNFAAMSSCGPWMVTADEIVDPRAMKLSTRLNGEEVQSATAGEMIFDIPTLVNYVSGFLHLEPGDVISTGSPEGSGGSRQPQRFLQPGDELEIEWSGIGTLKNRVIAAPQ